GICISFITGESIFLSKQQQADLDQIDGSCSFDGLQSEDQRQLHSLRDDYGDSPFDIRVYFVNKIYDPELKYLNGCGGYDPGRPALHTAFSATEWTFAHELGHVLLGANFRPVHLIGDTKNIMTEKTTNLKCDLPILTPLQLAAIKSSKYCRRCDEFGKPFYWKTTRKQIR
ncbi:MAG TPA: hypothetical protein PLA68_00925, partial [Panacibacter sp.]|nr:hypothetical protein [Panacibacter sp.]